MFLFFLLGMGPLAFLSCYWLMQFYFFIFCYFMLIGYKFSLVWSKISYSFGVDNFSLMLIILTVWVIALMMLASEKVFSEDDFVNIFCLLLLMLLLFLILTFCSMSLFMFYLFFESSLIPTVILILGWGYQPERLQAGIYLLFYTLLASLPMMISIFYYFLNFNSMIFCFYLGFLNNFYFYFFMILAFMVKIPMYFVHLWLPSAHVEAPISGSMILAGVMLKLGGYGLVRFMIYSLGSCLFFNFIFLIISLVGSLFISLICLRQVDIKMLIAYSSVSHMGMVLSGILTLSSWGFFGSLVMMIAHGLCSSGLFCLANINYERLNSRSIFLNKGLINVVPSLSLWWFLLSSSNMASPPSLNLLGEISLLISLVGWSIDLNFLLVLLMFFGVIYSLYLYSYSQHGNLFSGSFGFSLIYFREFFLLMLHWLPLNFLILCSDVFLL
uniref:NADH-ubiquinone oxidoreductase chain 4 n=1 Tax=Tenomerga trabecula TaxID=2843307 RepID=A0A8F0JXX5_9COLE|nr:NADH dehydrogenase subunit 4 [Tenomerga trabecula]